MHLSIRLDTAVASAQNFITGYKREAYIPRVRLADFQMHSVTPLNPPVCVACDAVMIWCRSLRLAPNLVVRYFYCPKCNGISRLTQRTDHRRPDPPIEYDSDKERADVIGL